MRGQERENVSIHDPTSPVMSRLILGSLWLAIVGLAAMAVLWTSQSPVPARFARWAGSAGLNALRGSASMNCRHRLGRPWAGLVGLLPLLDRARARPRSDQSGPLVFWLTVLLEAGRATPGRVCPQLVVVASASQRRVVSCGSPSPRGVLAYRTKGKAGTWGIRST